MRYEEIRENIKNHKKAYFNIGIYAPPYRISRKELKVIYNHMKEYDDKFIQGYHYDEMAYFLGVELEIVTIG